LHYLPVEIKLQVDCPVLTKNTTMSALTKLKRLRDLMSKHNITAYIVPTADAHQSEYVARRDARREFLTQFNGSAGTALVLSDDASAKSFDKKAFMWTDGRYFLQAEQQLDNNYWQLMKTGTDKPLHEFIALNAATIRKVGYDPSLYSINEYRSISNLISKQKKNAPELISVTENLVDEIWDDQPAIPNNKVFVLDEKFTGRSTTEKLNIIRKELEKKDCRYLILTALDEIAWLLNLRGSDISHNPLFFSYVLVSMDDATVFVDSSRFDNQVASHLEKANVKVQPYTSFISGISNLEGNVWIDPTSCNMAVFQAISRETDEHIVEDASPVRIAKSIKSDAECQGFRDCHIRDGVALVKLFRWIEDNIDQGITEVDVEHEALRLRKEQEHFISTSFDTIAGSGPNGAIIHYHANPETTRKLSRNEVFLLDSGAQYLDGTTDVTRTLHYGEPTAHEKECFTRVLKGHIALEKTVFPQSVTGYRMDIIARTALWKVGLDYNHGTGHGVGHFLCVHEGPHSIGTRLVSNDQFAILPNMTVTNEPGYYENGNFGIRIENVMLVKVAETKYRFNNRDYLTFESVTVSPIQTSFITKDLLVQEEIDWVNEYNAGVRSKLEPLLQDDPKTIEWLRKYTPTL
jgi:Xaa-Pro aminopeptidase